MSHPESNSTHSPQLKSTETVVPILQDLQRSQDGQKAIKRPFLSLDEKEIPAQKLRVKEEHVGEEESKQPSEPADIALEGGDEDNPTRLSDEENNKGPTCIENRKPRFKEEYVAERELKQPTESTAIGLDHTSGESNVIIKRPVSPATSEQESSKLEVTRQEVLVAERFAMKSVGTSTDPVIIIDPKDLVEASINTDPVTISNDAEDITSDEIENSESGDEDNWRDRYDADDNDVDDVPDFDDDDLQDFDDDELQDSDRSQESERTDNDYDDGADGLDDWDDDYYNDDDEEEPETDPDADPDAESDDYYDEDYSPPPTEYSSFRNELSVRTSLLSRLAVSQETLLGKRNIASVKETTSSLPIANSDQLANENDAKGKDSEATEPIQSNWSQSLDSSFEDIKKFLYPSSDEQKSLSTACKYDTESRCNLPGNMEALDKAFCVPRDTLDKVRQRVCNVISDLAKELTQRHSQFRFAVEPRGSGYNETKVGRPDEFDFLCILPEFGECNPQPCAANIIDVPNETIHNEDDDFTNYLQSCYQLTVASGNKRLVTQKLADSRTLLDAAAIKLAFHSALSDTTESLDFKHCKVLVNKESPSPVELRFKDLSYPIFVDLTPCVQTVQQSSCTEASEKLMKLVPSSKGFWKASNPPLIESLEELDDEISTKAFIRCSKIIRDMTLSLLFDNSLEQVQIEPKSIILPFVRGRRPLKLVFCEQTARMLIDWHHICERAPSFTDMTSYALQSNFLSLGKTEPNLTSCRALKTVFSDLQMKGIAEDKILFRLPENVHEAQRIVSAFLVHRFEALQGDERESFTATVTPPCYNTSRNVPDDIIPIATPEDRKKVRTKKGMVDVSIYTISATGLHEALQEEPWLKDRSFLFLSDLEEANLPAGDKQLEYVVVHNTHNWTTVDARAMIKELSDRSKSRISKKFSKKRSQGKGHSGTAEGEVRAVLVKI